MRQLKTFNYDSLAISHEPIKSVKNHTKRGGDSQKKYTENWNLVIFHENKQQKNLWNRKVAIEIIN